MARIQVVFKGKNYDILIAGNTAEEIVSEYDKIRGDLEALSPVKHGKKKRQRKFSKRGTTKIVREMIEDGFFKKPRTLRAIQERLSARGLTCPLTSIPAIVLPLVRKKELLRTKKKIGKREQWVYTSK